MAEPAHQSFAPAKVNLYLRVTGKRQNGYHELDSLVVFAGIGDTIKATPAQNLSLQVQGPFAAGVPVDEENLVLKAARRLAAEAGVASGAGITLDKRLPASAGIGGGSADAAATLRALCALWDITLDESTMAGIALDLGADVPVCLTGAPAFMSGIGERITLAPRLPDAWLVLANPGVALSTPAVFTARKNGFSQPASFSHAPADAAELAVILRARGNDLTEAARRLAPEVGQTLAALEGLDGALLSQMSGSGATCFALFARKTEADTAARNLTARHPEWWAAAAPLLGASQTS